MPDILNMRHITKQFGDFKANDDISIDVHQGEILALLGENGAGKTTLMNILYGLYKPTSGEILFDGKPVAIDSPLKAISLGIGMVHQHFMLVQAFKTWENIVLGLQDEQKIILKESIAKKKIMELADAYNLQINPDAQISTLSVGLQQQVELAKVLYRGSKLLILDEPTGVLTLKEKEQLFLTLRNLVKSGLSVIFISHKLDEVLEISDRVTVLNRGRVTQTVNTADVTKKDLARMMVGRDVVLTVEREKKAVSGEEVLVLDKVNAKGNRLRSNLKDLSLSLHKGEILGIAGVDGNGQSELVEVISGLRPVQSGSISLNGKPVANLTPDKIIAEGTAFIPEDRKKVGTVHSFTIDRNMILRNLSDERYIKKGLIDQRKLKTDTDATIEEFDVRLSGRNHPVSSLSGGNLQKVILARELRDEPVLLVAMHPTRGLDVGAIEFIHRKILEAADKGTAVLLVSTEMEEILSLSDTIRIISDGRLSEPLREEDMNPERLGLLLGGSAPEKAPEAAGSPAEEKGGDADE